MTIRMRNGVDRLLGKIRGLAANNPGLTEDDIEGHL